VPGSRRRRRPSPRWTSEVTRRSRPNRVRSGCRRIVNQPAWDLHRAHVQAEISRGPSTFTQAVRGRAGIQRPGAERLDLKVAVLGHDRDLRQSGDADCSTNFSIYLVDTPTGRRSNSQSGKWEPSRSYGIASSNMPAPVSHSRCR
jgi:hypothetical protein